MKMSHRTLIEWRWIFTGLLALAAGSGLQAQADPLTGLWVGRVTLNAVSDANPIVSDLSFDLGVDGLLIRETLIARGAAWRFADTGTDRGTAWRELNYDDSAWSTGPAELGYGDGDEATLIASNVNPTVYFRKTFAVAQPAKYSSLRVRLLKDDGAVVYLNGAQIRRSNLSSIYNFTSLALSRVYGTNELTWEEFTVPANLLQSNNVMAVELHQYAAPDPDASFNLELTATVADPVAINLSPVQAVWKYDDTGADLGAAWWAPAYDDSGWSSGPAPLGYGNGTNQDVTTIGYGNETNKNKTTYFRTRFTVTDTNSFSHLDLYLLRDDGAVVYVNSNEVLRSNMPADGAIVYDTPPTAAITAKDEFQYIRHRIESKYLINGTNVLAVEVHQYIGELGEAGSVLTPAPAELALRIMIHVDTNDTARLLKEVIQMWQDGTYRQNPDGTKEIDTPGHYVLLLDDTKISDYTGISQRDGESAGRRISAVGFDFEGRFLTLTGSVHPGNSVQTAFTLPADFATNPFRHKYHPDHQAGFEVTRGLRLDFSSRYPSDSRLPESDPPAGWGQTLLGGTYQETLTGLHKRPIQTQGYFELRRVAGGDELVQ